MESRDSSRNIGITNLLNKCFLNPIVFDVYPNSIRRIFESENNIDIAVIDLNFDNMNFCILEKGVPFMYSNITLNNSPNYSQTNTKDLINIEDDIEFSTYIDEIIAYLKTYFNFFSSRHFGKSVDIIHIIGRISMINNIENIFNQDSQPYLSF